MSGKYIPGKVTKIHVPVAEIAERLGICRPTAYKHLKNGTIPGRVRSLGVFRVRRDLFEPWFETQRVPQSVSVEETKRLKEDLVYFIEQEHGDHPIKIGFSTVENFKTRLATLRGTFPYPLKLLGTLSGGRKLEQRLHAKFRKDRLGGEWFRPSETLQKLLATLEKPKDL